MDFSKLSSDETGVEGGFVKRDPHPHVRGRILHTDADFYAYQCGYRWEEESVEQSIHALRLLIQSHRILAGADEILLYLTMGTKGGREDTARTKAYQEQRSKRAEGLVERVRVLRDWMANCTDPNASPMASHDQEADDALTQAMYVAVANGTENLNILMSADKDLYMAPGLHMNTTTYEIEDYSVGFGSSVLDKSTTTTKVVGKGTSFFWHQLLMGDGADNIPGLPFFSKEIVLKYWPTKAMLNAEARVAKARTTKQSAAAHAALNKQMDALKSKSCGAVRTFEYLRKARSDKDAFHMVREAYQCHYGYGPFEHTAHDGVVSQQTAGDMLIEQARLLWMRRTKDEDVMVFFKEVMA